MGKARAFHSVVQANRANRLYQRADEEWQRGRLRSAFRLMLAAAQAGMAPAFAPVAYFYDYGEGTRVNRDAALYWYRRAYRNGDYSAANNIGCIWRDRNKVARALLWLHRAVELGDADANLNIAKIYLYNKRDLGRAIQYLNKTCKSGHATEGSKEEARALLRQAKKGKAKRTHQILPPKGARPLRVKPSG